MKQALQNVFQYIAQPENFTISIILIMLYTLFVIIVGMIIAWAVFFFISKKFRYDNDPVSFDDLVNPTNGFRRRKVH